MASKILVQPIGQALDVPVGLFSSKLSGNFAVVLASRPDYAKAVTVKYNEGDVDL